MKTLASTAFTCHTQEEVTTKQTQCANIGNRLYLHWLSLAQLACTTRLRIKQILIAPAVRVALVTLAACSKTLSTNGRLYWGIALMLVAAPVAGSLHYFFSAEITNPEWFYGGYYNYFLVVDPYLFDFFMLAGVYLLFPPLSKRSALLAIPIGQMIGNIIYLSSITSNEEFQSPAPYTYIISGIAFAFIIGFCFNWMMHRKFHRHDAIIARIYGLIECKGLDPDTKVRLLMEQEKSLKQFHANF